MCFVYFQNMTGTRFKFVPYRGAAPALQDLVGGHIDLLRAEGGQTLSQYRAGSIRAFNAEPLVWSTRCPYDGGGGRAGP